MITVQTPSRLHFGLFSLAAAAHWPDHDGQPVLPARRFGGVGLMVQQPGLELTVRPAAAWSAAGPLAERALRAARQLAAVYDVPPQQLTIERSAAEHTGLGTGTQLALAVAQALCTASGRPWDDAAALQAARCLGRGQRSALGLHGARQGGFLVEGGQAAAGAVAPLLLRQEFPDAWRVVLVLLPIQGLHGPAEREAFTRLQEQPTPAGVTDALCRLTLLGMLPALAERDLDGFGDALYDFNRRVGALFAPVQGGEYAHPAVADVVAYLRQQGIRGVGQSSWGPAVFAVVADDEHATALAEQLRRRFSLGTAEVICTAACNRGACCGADRVV